MKWTFPRIIFLLVLIISFFIRIIKIDFPLSFGFAWGDGTRDYLVANHILKYGERPTLGPFNLLFDNGIYSSPIYFYILSLMLIPFNNILTLSIVNIFLQLSCIVLVYLIAKKLFDIKTALFAFVLFSFNPEVLHQSDYIWQPYLMQPISFLALYFLIQKQTIAYFLLALALALHYSAAPWVVIFLLYSQTIKKNLINGAVFISSLLIFYLPVFLKVMPPNIFDSSFASLIADSFSKYFSNLNSNINQFFSIFNPFDKLVFFLFILLSLFYFLKFNQKNAQRKQIFFILLLFLSPIVTASFFNKIRPHYLTLSLGAFSILTAGVLIRITYGKVWARIILASLILIIFSANFSFVKQIKAPFVSLKLINYIGSKVKDELVDIKLAEGYRDFSFFQVYSIAAADSTFYYQTLDTILLVSLEDKLSQRIVKLKDFAYSQTQIGGNKYLIMACHKFIDLGDEDCLKEFKKSHASFKILKPIYLGNPISVFLAKSS